MASEQFSLVLGCGGQKHHNIVLCAGTYNTVINFNRHFEAEELKKIMDFLDFACGLFDTTMGDWNKIINTLKMLRERHHLLDDKLWEALHLWLPLHKRCGAFMRLMFNADIESTLNKTIEEKLIEPEYLECPTLPESSLTLVQDKRPAKKMKKPEKKALAPGLKPVKQAKKP